MTLIHEFAPAKLNLYLHITGRQANGYHDLDSIVAFASIGDEIAVRSGKGFRFEITGPQAAALENEDVETNLAVKAARSLAEMTGHSLDATMVLVKKLPIASGIGGGSSDATASLRALAKLWGLKADDPRIMQAAAKHGQDVPVCLKIENTYMTATGVMPAPKLPRADIVLINPNKGLPTPAVYKEFREGGYKFSPLSQFEKKPASVGELVAMLKLRGNDLYAPALKMMPEIGEILSVLEASGECLLARMSGSGASCFGIYPDAMAAKSAAAQIRAQRLRWWVETGVINE
ncbi:MAG: 4-(cytidine 5'-diphospho)-2-C-methyl-D-erythritol kinase [Bdellovibrionales bacterium]